jgi:hypothetical protein
VSGTGGLLGRLRFSLTVPSRVDKRLVEARTMYHDSETFPYQPTEQDERDFREYIEYLASLTKTEDGDA